MKETFETASDGKQGFKREYFDYLAGIEARHFWHQARQKLILWAMAKHIFGMGSFLEIGCGTGLVLKAVGDAYPGVRLSGSDVYLEGIQFAREKCPDADLFQMNALKIPFVEEIDVIGAFDVLEHIKEDEAVLAQIYNALRPQGYLILTVPQHPFLWSNFDVMSCHVRRYTAKDLEDKIKKAGFTMRTKISFMSLLFPMMAVNRLFQKKGPCNVKDWGVLEVGKTLNTVCKIILSFELALLKMGLRFPFGGSLLVIAQKSGMRTKEAE